MAWVHLGSLFEMGLKRGATATHDLTLAYRNVFSGNGSKQEAQIVLADLADYTGFYQVSPEGSPSGLLLEANGKRAVFGRLFRFLEMSDAEVEALRQAARQETITSQHEGEI